MIYGKLKLWRTGKPKVMKEPDKRQLAITYLGSLEKLARMFELESNDGKLASIVTLKRRRTGTL